tara:strand:- start:40 stop:285 length:246 start_codon:yes stop_codon:yes gene_type:complete
MKMKKEIKENLTVAERRERHMERHPNDKNEQSEVKGVTWSKRTQRDKDLDLFYKQNIYTFVDEKDLSKKRWVRIAGRGEEE